MSFNPLSSERVSLSFLPLFSYLILISKNYQRIVRRGAVRNSWERVFNTHLLIKVMKGLAPDPAWHTTSAELC